MNRYLIECINDCKNEFVVAYAPSMYDDNMSKAADDYAYELAVSIVDDEFIVTAEGYDYEYMTDEDVLKVLNSIDWDEYYNYIHLKVLMRSLTNIHLYMTEEVSSKLSLLTRKLAEVGQLKGEIADKLFEEADAGIITKEQALEILDTYNLLPTDGYVSLPPYLDSYEYFERYSKVNYMDYTVPENFEEGQNLCCPLFPGITYEEAIDGFVKKNRIIGCVYDW